MIHYLNLPTFDDSFKKNLQKNIDEIYWNNFIPLPTDSFLKCYPDTNENFAGRCFIWAAILDSKIKKCLTEYLKDNSNLNLVKALPLNFGLVLLKNLNLGVNAFFPPHIDCTRNVGINLILEKGGTDACLELYDPNSVPDYCDKNNTPYWNHKNLKIIERQHIIENVWHSFQASKPHSVVGITTRRTTLLMNFPFDSYNFFLTRKEFFIL